MRVSVGTLSGGPRFLSVLHSGQEKGSGTCSYSFLAALPEFLRVTSPPSGWASAALTPSAHLSVPLREPGSNHARGPCSVSSLLSSGSLSVAWVPVPPSGPGGAPTAKPTLEDGAQAEPGSRKNPQHKQTCALCLPPPRSWSHILRSLQARGSPIPAVSWIRDPSWSRSLYCSSDYAQSPESL